MATKSVPNHPQNKVNTLRVFQVTTLKNSENQKCSCVTFVAESLAWHRSKSTWKIASKSSQMKNWKDPKKIGDQSRKWATTSKILISTSRINGRVKKFKSTTRLQTKFIKDVPCFHVRFVAESFLKTLWRDIWIIARKMQNKSRLKSKQRDKLQSKNPWNRQLSFKRMPVKLIHTNHLQSQVTTQQRNVTISHRPQRPWILNRRIL